MRIGVIPISDLAEGGAGDVVGVFQIRLDDGQHLTAHTLNRVLIKARLREGGFQKGKGFVTILGQEPRRDREGVA